MDIPVAPFGERYSGAIFYEKGESKVDGGNFAVFSWKFTLKIHDCMFFL